MKKPVNTTEQVHRDPMGFLLNAMVMESSGAIEHQEARGQADFVNSESLPYKGSNGENRKIFESLGFKFGEHDGQDLFIEVQMPAGWKKVRTDHSMWSNLVDDKGRIRASIFYKAAFYDRDAFITLMRRFTVQKQYADVTGIPLAVEVRDCGTPIHSIPVPPPLPSDVSREDKLKRYDDEDKLIADARDWLRAKYPDYENDAAYWD